MLVELTLTDLALFARAGLEFGAGLNAVTGETGAGKSLVIDALELLLGKRAKAALVRKGAGTLVSSVYSDDRKFVDKAFTGIAPYTGRLYLGSAKVAEYAMGSGLVLPECVHGGPGRAGGGEELGGVRGLHHFMQRLAVQGSRPMVQTLTKTTP